MASRTIKTPGATTETTGQTTTEIADAALDHIQTDETPDIKVAEPTNEELKRQLEEMQAQLAELKKSTQGEANASSGSTGEVKPKKRIPVLTKDGWITKEAD
ncbi:hypothetical protein ABTJ36_09010 [Acinetobacter baumannii]